MSWGWTAWPPSFLLSRAGLAWGSREQVWSPSPPVRPAGVFVTPAPVPSGVFPRCSPDWPFVTSGVTWRRESAVFRFLHQLLPSSVVELGSFFPFSALPVSPLPAWGPRLSSLYFWTSLCCNYVQRTWWVQGGCVRSIFCPLVLLPQCSCTHLFKGTCTGTGNVPPLPTCHPPCSLSSSPTFLCILRLLLLCLHQGPHLWPCFPSSPYLGKGPSLELQGVEPNVYILFCLCSHPVRRFEESEKNLLLYLGLSPALLFDDRGTE